MFLNIGQSMSFTGPMIHVCAFRLSVWKLFVPILRSIASFSFSEILYKSRRTFCFPFLQTSAICIFLPCLLVTCIFLGRSRCFRWSVNFFIIWWLLSSKERVQWALHLFPFQHTLAHVLIHQRKIDKDLWNEITKATILYPTVYFVSWVEPRLLFSIFPVHFLKGLSLAILCLFQGPFSTFWDDTKKITCISQRVITLLVQRTSGEDKWTTVKFEHC